MENSWKDDAAYFAAWWSGVPLVTDGLRRDDILAHFIGKHHGSFAEMGVRAWRLRIPEHWSAAVKAYRAHIDKAMDLRQRMVEAEGELFANTHTMGHDEQEAYLKRLNGELVGKLSPHEEQLVGE